MNNIKISKMENMSKEQLFETLLLIELIEKREIIEIIEKYKKEKNSYTKLEIEIIDNKIEKIKKMKEKKYIKKEICENLTIYSYTDFIKIYWKEKTKEEELIKEINKHKKNAYIKEKEKIKKIDTNDLFYIMKKEKYIILK